MTRYAISDRVIVQKILDETVLLDTHKGEYFELNSMGSEMLRRLADHGDPDKLVTQILADYDADEHQVRSDVTELLQRLEANGLLTQIPA